MPRARSSTHLHINLCGSDHTLRLYASVFLRWGDFAWNWANRCDNYLNTSKHRLLKYFQILYSILVWCGVLRNSSSKIPELASGEERSWSSQQVSSSSQQTYGLILLYQLTLGNAKRLVVAIRCSLKIKYLRMKKYFSS